MARNYELCFFVLPQHIVDQQKKIQLVLGRERGFRLVQQEQAIPLELQFKQRKKCLTMGPRVQAAATVGCADRCRKGRFVIQVVHVGHHVEEALGTQKETSPGSFVERESKALSERVDRSITLGAAAAEIAISSLGPKTIVRCDCFQQGRFPRAVLARKKADAGAKIKFLQAANCRDRKRIALPILYPFSQ